MLTAREIQFLILAFGLILLCTTALMTPFYFITPAIPISLVIALLIYRFPDLGLLLLVFLVPIDGAFPEGAHLSSTKAVGIVLGAIALLKIFRKEIPLFQLKTNLWRPIGLLVFIFILSALYSPYPELSFQSIRQLITAILVFFITLCFSKRANPVAIMRTATLSITVTALASLISAQNSLDARATGFLEDPNYFALLLTLGTPLAIYLILNERLTFHKLLWLSAFTIMLIALQNTYSRSGLVVFGVCAAVLLFHYRDHFLRMPPPKLALLILSTILFFGLSIALMPKDYQARILSIVKLSAGTQSFEDRSLGRRTSYILVGAEAFKTHPLIGTGPGTFPVHYATSGYATAFSLSKQNPDLYRRAHNTYLEILAETGILGFAAFTLLIFMGLSQYGRARRLALLKQDQRAAKIATHFGVSLIAIVIFMLFLTGLTNKFFWILLALGAQTLRRQEKHLMTHSD